jgi:hypothetical protein
MEPGSRPAITFLLSVPLFSGVCGNRAAVDRHLQSRPAGKEVIAMKVSTHVQAGLRMHIIGGG